MRRNKIEAAIAGAALCLTLSCGNAGVEPVVDSNDFDAITNIITFDRTSEFNLGLLDFSTPDTSGLFSAPYQPIYYWRNLTSDSQWTDIRIYEPTDEDTLGAVRWAKVDYHKRFQGTFEVIAEDTSGGEDIPIRLSKPFDISGTINGIFEKVGFDYNTRRGWILSRLSDASLVSSSAPPQISELAFWAENNPQQVYHLHGPIAMRLIPEFESGDSITIRIRSTQPNQFVSLRYSTGGGMVTRHVSAETTSVYVGGFVMPSAVGFEHFLFDMISNTAVTDTLPYGSLAYGFIYRIR
jgi:ribosomal protein L21E